jgi:hypothetical protein
MKKFLAVVFFCLPAFGQAAYSGLGLYSGSAAFGSAGGAPLTYSARTDNCVTGAETGCVGGRTTGQAGSPMLFMYRPTDTVPFTNLAPSNTAATDPDFNTYMVMVTDTATAGQTSNFIMGDTGSWAAFSQDNTLFLVKNNGGGAWVYQVNPSLIRAKGCSPSTPCVTKSRIRDGATDSTHLVSRGSWSWSHIPGESNVLYELGTNGTLVYKDTINTSGAPSAWTLTRTTWVDFTSDTPTPCSVLPTSYSNNWSSSWTVGNDGSVNVGETGAGDWQSSWTPTVTETFIYPILNNSGKKGFQATTVAGATGGTEPNWASSCNTTGSTCTDGGVTWTNIGTLSGQGPGFDVVSYQPGVGCSRINTRLGKIYRGTGNAQPAGYWTTDDDITCARLGQSPPCSIGDTMTLHGATQTFNPAYGLLAPTGAGAVSCLAPGTCSCSETNSTYMGAWSSGTTYALHNLVYYNTSWYQSKTSSNTGNQPDTNPTNWKPDDAYCYLYVWQKNTTTIRPCIEIGTVAGNDCDQHEGRGYDSFYAGGKYASHYFSKPSIGGAGNPGVKSIPSPLPADRHESYQNVSPGDKQPIMFAGTDVPTATANYTTAGYSEDIAVSTDGTQTIYRFLHNYGTGSSPFFAVQNAVGDISQDGTLAAIGTDMMGTRGSASSAWAVSNAYALGDMIFPVNGNTAGVEFQVLTAPTGPSGGTEPTWSTCTTTCTDGGVTWTNTGKSCNNLRAYFSPAAGNGFSANDTILPVTNNVGGDIYQAQNSGTTGSTVPNWNISCPNYGDTCTSDGTVNWKNIGPNTCRGDIMMMDLLSAHAAP